MIRSRVASDYMPVSNTPSLTGLPPSSLLPLISPLPSHFFPSPIALFPISSSFSLLLHPFSLSPLTSSPLLPPFSLPSLPSPYFFSSHFFPSPIAFSLSSLPSPYPLSPRTFSPFPHLLSLLPSSILSSPPFIIDFLHARVRK